MHDFTILALDDAYASSLAATLDILVAARALAPRLGVPVPRWRLCAPEPGLVRLQGGMQVEATRLPVRARDDRSTWVLPGLGLNTTAAITQRLARPDTAALARRIARHVQGGGRVVASCSSVFLLQPAGLLAGRRATTSWWHAPLLQRLAPGCTVDADRMVCADGPITTAGAAFAQTDLMLHLLRAHGGAALADAVSRMLLIDGRQAQAPYIVAEVLANGDSLVAQLAARVEAALPNPPSVAALAEAFCMSERTLSRRIRQATGKSTLALVQSVRLRRARALLEGSRMTVDQVAEAVGYQDATALRRLMKKVAGANPSRYRPATMAAACDDGIAAPARQPG
ncbi:AraC family transcriptional regulator [Comamonas serinivorans]|uniref:AraC family transcriptional regulator n=1 Tax=Comamonas serinivorans TaxID=1082851 RepID=A0A1Y0EKK8_9BURK|nr:helix-turn-helix domain-containing protein [Comamonas serinivorans]ARU04174.1 AraC family transcriptional regulator [Comamonas serinivorans]